MNDITASHVVARLLFLVREAIKISLINVIVRQPPSIAADDRKETAASNKIRMCSVLFIDYNYWLIVVVFAISPVNFYDLIIYLI